MGHRYRVSLIPERELATVVVNGLRAVRCGRWSPFNRRRWMHRSKRAKFTARWNLYQYESENREVNLIAADSVEASQLLVFWGG